MFEKFPDSPQGKTRTESVLHGWGQRAFFSMWSHPNITYKRGKHCKELCDLLIAFENIYILFSVKDIKFDYTDDIARRWDRWFRKAIEDSAGQLIGAETTLMRGEKLYSSNDCGMPFPLTIPDLKTSRFYRVVIANGASERKDYKSTDAPEFSNQVMNHDHFTYLKGKPFVLGGIRSKSKFVHLFYDDSFQDIVRYLNTITDFVGYLDQRERLFERKELITANTEQDLLALYLTSLDNDGNHFIDLPELSPEREHRIENNWANLATNPNWIAKQEADKVSIIWDIIIERTARHGLTQTHRYTNAPTPDGTARSLKYLSKESRFRRRILSGVLQDLSQRINETKLGIKLIRPSTSEESLYVLIVMPKLPQFTEDEYRSWREEILYQYCMAANLQNSNRSPLIGIAINPIGTSNITEDILFMDPNDWTPEQNAEALKFEEVLQLSSRSKQFVTIEYEFPRPNNLGT